MHAIILVYVVYLHTLYAHTCSEVTSSQPVHHREAGEGVDSAGAVNSFTQPSRFDELIIGTQIPCTPGASQVSLQQCHIARMHVSRCRAFYFYKWKGLQPPPNISYFAD